MASAPSTSKTQALRAAAFALVATPVLVAAAPSHAALTPKTFTSFTDPFALNGGGWTTLVNGTSATVTTASADSQLKFYRAANLNIASSSARLVTPGATYSVDADQFNTFAPTSSSGRAMKFVKGSLDSFAWDWTTTTTGATNIGTYRFGYSTNIGGTAVTTQLLSGTSGTQSGSKAPALEMFDGDTFGFFGGKSNTNGGATGATGTIKNFSFTAYYTDVPGPLPLAGAAGAFAWSRRLRRRLKDSASFA
jgi:hypothetical protein